MNLYSTIGEAVKHHERYAQEVHQRDQTNTKFQGFAERTGGSEADEEDVMRDQSNAECEDTKRPLFAVVNLHCHTSPKTRTSWQSRSNFVDEKSTTGESQFWKCVSCGSRGCRCARDESFAGHHRSG